MSEFVFGDSVWVIDLVAEDEEGDLAEIFHGEKGVQLGFGFGQALMVFCVYEEDDAGDFREVVAPEAAGCEDRVSVGSMGHKVAEDLPCW